MAFTSLCGVVCEAVRVRSMVIEFGLCNITKADTQFILNIVH